MPISDDPFAQYLQSIGAGGGFGFDFGTTNPFSPVPPISTVDTIFADLLDEQPEIPFAGALQRANLTPNQKEYFRNQRQNIYGQFQGLLDQQIRSGQAPDARFSDFIGNFDFNRNFQNIDPSRRFGGNSGRFNPITSFGRGR